MLRRRHPRHQTAHVRAADRSEVALIRKPFAEFAADIAAGLCAGSDLPIAETAQFGVVEVAPGDWRLRLVLDHARSSATRAGPPARRRSRRSSIGSTAASIRIRSAACSDSNPLHSMIRPECACALAICGAGVGWCAQAD